MNSNEEKTHLRLNMDLKRPALYKHMLLSLTEFV